MNTGLISQPAAEYHASDAVSNSRLKWISAPRHTPAHYRAKWIDKAIPDEQTPAMEFGSLLHRCLLEPETVEGAFHVKPDDMSFTTKEGKAWRAEHDDRTIISAAQEQAVRGMIASLMAHKTARKIIEGSDKERSAFADDNGMLLKARYDLWPTWDGANFIADVKTCEWSDEDSAGATSAKLGYYRQAAFYLRVAKLMGMPRKTFLFIFVEKTPPYSVSVLDIDPTDLEAGQTEIFRDLTLLRQCRDNDDWPGRGHGIGLLSSPAWKRKEMEALAAV